MLGIKMPVLCAAGSANPVDFSELDAGPTIHPFTSGHLNAGGRLSTGISPELGNFGVRAATHPVLDYYVFTDGATAQATPRGYRPPRPSPSMWNYTLNEFHVVKTGVRC